MTTRNWRIKEKKGNDCEASLRCQKPYVPSTKVVEVFTTVGTTTWSSPINLKDVNIFMVGGGGGGGGSYDTGAGGGGGGGFVLIGTTNINGNTPYSIIVGDGGDGGYGDRDHSTVKETDGSDGGYSQFASVIAPGGKGGKSSRNTGSTPGAGGENALGLPGVRLPGRGGYGIGIGENRSSTDHAGGGGGNNGDGSNPYGGNGLGHRLTEVTSINVYGKGGTGGIFMNIKVD